MTTIKTYNFKRQYNIKNMFDLRKAFIDFKSLSKLRLMHSVKIDALNIGKNVSEYIFDTIVNEVINKKESIDSEIKWTKEEYLYIIKSGLNRMLRCTNGDQRDIKYNCEFANNTTLKINVSYKEYVYDDDYDDIFDYPTQSDNFETEFLRED